MTNASMTSNFAHMYKEPILVTAVYFTLYYIFLFSQAGISLLRYLLATKTGNEKEVSLRKLKYSSAENDRLLLTLNRSVGNIMEQMVPFLASLWLHALTLSPRRAAIIGAIYTLLRSFYPFAFYRGIVPLFLVTFPNYFCILYLIAPVVWTCLFQ